MERTFYRVESDWLGHDGNWKYTKRDFVTLDAAKHSVNGELAGVSINEGDSFDKMARLKGMKVYSVIETKHIVFAPELPEEWSEQCG